MKMKKVWKLAPYECFEVDAIEGWLDEMSQKGLQFRVQYGRICIFECNDSPARYRVDIRRKGDNDRTDGARYALYREMGWEYCNDYFGYAEVFRSIDKSAPELHTDRETLLPLIRTCCRKLLWYCLFSALMITHLLHALTDAAETAGGWSALFSAPVYLPGAIVLAALALALLIEIFQTLTGWLRLRKNGYQQLPHSAERARRGCRWARIQVMLTSSYFLYVLYAMFFLLSLLF